MSNTLAMTETSGIRDIFASGLGSVEDVGGGCYRFTLFSMQEIHGQPKMVVVAKIVMPLEALPGALSMATKLTHICVCENARLMAMN